MKHSLWLPSALFPLLLGVATCDTREDHWDGGEVDTYCQLHPGDCFGEIGGDCSVTDDCDDGVCCHDKNCGSGMCTYLCDADGDCPSEMLCEHGYCFFRCDEDSDCGPGQKCEHNHTICEYT